MEKWLKDMSPIMDVEHDCIISKKGDISIVFKVILPEVFTMFDDDFEALHQGFIKAIKVLPKECIFHKQDWYIRSTYQGEPDTASSSFLSVSSNRYFKGRSFMKHDSYIILTKKPANRKTSTSLLSSLVRPSLVSPEMLSAVTLREMEDSAGQFQTILNGSGLYLERMREEELVSEPGRIGFIERYYSLSEDPSNLVVKDLELKPDLRIGDQYCQVYTLADTDHLPPMCGSRITYNPYSTDRTKYPGAIARLQSHL